MQHKLLKHIALALLMLAALPFAKAQVAVGDILCEGGQIYSPTAYLSSGATAIGVVFYVDGTGQHGWAVALEDAGSFKWASAGVDTPLVKYSNIRQAIYDLDGYYNTQVIRQYGTTYPAFYAVDFDNGWYLPAVGQLNYLYGNLVEVNAGLNVAGATPFEMDGNWMYWSSTDYTDTRGAWYMDSNGAFDSNVFAEGHKFSTHRVRGVRNF